MAKNLDSSREEIIERMVGEAEQRVATRCWPCASTRPRWAGTGRKSAHKGPPSESETLTMDIHDASAAPRMLCVRVCASRAMISRSGQK